MSTFWDSRFKADWLEIEEQSDLLKHASIESMNKLLKRKTAAKHGNTLDRSQHDQHSSSSEGKEVASKALLSFMPSKTSRKKRKIDSGLTKENLLEDEIESYFAEKRESMDCDVLGYWKKEHRFSYLKIAAWELLGMTATSAPPERVFSHASELHSAKRANLGARIFSLLMLMRMNPCLGMNWTWIKLDLIWVNVIRILVQFLSFANPLILILIHNPICHSWVSSNFNSNLI